MEFQFYDMKNLIVIYLFINNFYKAIFIQGNLMACIASLP